MNRWSCAVVCFRRLRSLAQNIQKGERLESSLAMVKKVVGVPQRARYRLVADRTPRSSQKITKPFGKVGKIWVLGNLATSRLVGYILVPLGPFRFERKHQLLLLVIVRPWRSQPLPRASARAKWKMQSTSAALALGGVDPFGYGSRCQPLGTWFGLFFPLTGFFRYPFLTQSHLCVSWRGCRQQGKARLEFQEFGIVQGMSQTWSPKRATNFENHGKGDFRKVKVLLFLTNGSKSIQSPFPLMFIRASSCFAKVEAKWGRKLQDPHRHYPWEGAREGNSAAERRGLFRKTVRFGPGSGWTRVNWLFFCPEKLQEETETGRTTLFLHVFTRGFLGTYFYSKSFLSEPAVALCLEVFDPIRQGTQDRNYPDAQRFEGWVTWVMRWVEAFASGGFLGKSVVFSQLKRLKH